MLNGVIEAEAGKEKMTEAMIAAAFRDCDQARLATVREAIENLVADIPAISDAFDRNAGRKTRSAMTSRSLLQKLRNNCYESSMFEPTVLA